MNFKSLTHYSRGFTLIEVLVVASITVLISVSMISNFPRTRINIIESANAVVADIRQAQTKAVTSTQYNSSIRCGYGIYYINSNSYGYFTGPDAALTDCSTYGRTGINGSSTTIKTAVLFDQKLEIKQSFRDIFFEPPRPKIYFNNAYSATDSEKIVIGKIGSSCDTVNCRTICLYTSGKIETFPNSVLCP